MGKDDEAKVFLLPLCCLINNIAYDDRFRKEGDNMHKFMRTIGFSMYQKKQDMEKLLRRLAKEAERIGQLLSLIHIFLRRFLPISGCILFVHYGILNHRASRDKPFIINPLRIFNQEVHTIHHKERIPFQ